VILERISVTAGLMARGYRQAGEMLPDLNEWAQRKGEPPLTISTIHSDMRRARILAVESATEESLNVVYSMAEVEREAWHRTMDDNLPPDSRVKREYLELAGRMVEARGRHERQGIEAALAERGMVLAEQMGEALLNVVIEVISSAPIDRQTQMLIRDRIADGIQAKVIDARPVARLDS
jgi:hypothetical protein